MYALYSVLIVAFCAVMSPYLAVSGGAIPEVHRQPAASGSGYLPRSFNLDGDESIWIHAVSVGEVLTARALLPELRERYPKLRLFLSTTTMTGQQIARNNLQYVDEVFYFPFDLGFIVNRTLRPGEAAAVHHDGDRALAEPPARLPPRAASRRARQRPHLVALVSALPAGAAVLPPRAAPRRSLLHAERRVGAAHHRHRRRAASASSSPAR